MSKDGLTPEGERIFRELEKLGKMVVNIGFQSGTKYPNGKDVVEVAAYNEYGTYNMPSRPFLSDSVEDNEDAIVSFLQSQVIEIIQNGKTAEQVLKDIGVFQKDLVQSTIEEGEFEPNADITINGGWMHNKKSGKLFYVEGKKVNGKVGDRPLIDNGTMKNAVNFVIEKKG